MSKPVKYPVRKIFSLSIETAKALDDYRRGFEKIPSESDALRTLVELGLSALDQHRSEGVTARREPRRVKKLLSRTADESGPKKPRAAQPRPKPPKEAEKTAGRGAKHGKR
jgi:hypothetical protein